MTPKQGLAFVKQHGIVLKAARGPVPSLAETIAGGPIRGSWWGHPKSGEIFEIINALADSDDVLVCKLIDGKDTFVHRRMWPALVKLAERFPRDRVAKVWQEHSDTGAHRARSLPFPRWAPPEALRDANAMTVSRAEALFASCGVPVPSGR